MVTPGTPLDQVDDLRLDAVDHVDLAALQGRGARGGVVDDDDLDLVGMAHLVALPVVGEALAAVAHAGLVDRDLVRAGANAGIGLVLAAVRLDDQVIVARADRAGRRWPPSASRTTSLPLALMLSMPFI